MKLSAKRSEDESRKEGRETEAEGSQERERSARFYRHAAEP